MPLPKRRHSRMRADKRRTHWKVSAPSLAECPQCHQKKLSHVVCPHCGFYKGRQVVAIKEKKRK